MPNSEVYVAAICINNSGKKAINVSVSHERAPSSLSITEGTRAIIPFINPENGYRIPATKEEFLSSHQIVGDVQPEGTDWFIYEYTAAPGELSEEGKLTIYAVNTNFIITGSAIEIQ